MFGNPALRYLVSAETLALFVTGGFWMRVWALPTADRLKLAALSSAMLVAFRALALSIAIVLTTAG